MRTRLAATLAGAVVACVPATAHAAPLDLQETAETWASCHAPVIEKPFLAYGDSLDYVLAPSGSFEGAATGWDLNRGAKVVAGNDPFSLRSGTDDQVLALPPNSSAVSPVMCVDLDYPTFRFAVADLASNKKLKVKVLYPDAPDPDWMKVGSINPETPGWRLSDHTPLLPEAGGSEPGARRVAIRIQAPSDVGYLVDDIYVDPRSRN